MAPATDIRGKEFKVGQTIARPSDFFTMTLCIVTKVEDGKVYLDNSPQAMKHPTRLAILGIV